MSCCTWFTLFEFIHLHQDLIDKGCVFQADERGVEGTKRQRRPG